MKTEEIKTRVDTIFSRHGLADKLTGELVVSTPLTGEKIGSVVPDSTDVLDRMLHKSSLAYEKWRTLDTNARANLLTFLAEKIAVNADDLAKIVHYDSGKSLNESKVEVMSTVALIHGTIKAAAYEPLPSGAKRSKEFAPLGIISIISPFNFPMAIGMWTGIPALLAGNAVINKPSENALLVSILYESIFKNAVEEFYSPCDDSLELQNVFQVAIGGPEIGKILVADRRVAKVIFTGSIAGCEQIKETDGKIHRPSKALTEGGAANFAVVSNMHDPMTRQAYITFVVEALMKSFLPYGGQKCINTRQIIAHETIFDGVVDEFKKQLGAFQKNWRVDNAFSQNNPFEFTALINQRAGERFRWALRQTLEQGGELIGGERLSNEGYQDAQYFMPALAVFKAPVSLMDEEIFGPFLTMAPYTGNIHDALALAQKPNANLVNAYYGSNEEEFEIFKRMNTAGFALINPPLGTGLLPPYGLGFGGNGLSGQGESLPRDPLLPFVLPEGQIRRNVVFELPNTRT